MIVRDALRPVRDTVMHFRFSLRMVFVALTLTAIVVYTLLVRPTALANRFVSAVKHGDYETAKSLSNDRWIWDFHYGDSRAVCVDRVEADLLPQEWHDIWSCQRRITFQVAYREDTG